MSKSSPANEVLDFLNSIEGAGYGGMAAFEIARQHAREMVDRATPTGDEEPAPFYGAQCPSYPNCSGGCGLGCTHEIEEARRARSSAATGEPVAYRWRQPGNKHWIYDPTPEWIEDHKHEIELEPLFTSAAQAPQGIEGFWRRTAVTLQEENKRLRDAAQGCAKCGAVLHCDDPHPGDWCLDCNMALDPGDWCLDCNMALDPRENDLANKGKRIRAAAQPSLGPCTQAELDAFEGLDSKSKRLFQMWVDRALKAEAALAVSSPERK